MRIKGYMDVRKAAEYLGLSERAVRHLIELRKIPYRRPQGYRRIFFRQSDLDEWICSGELVAPEDVQ